MELHKLRDFEAGVVDLLGALDGERDGGLLAPAGDHIEVPDVDRETGPIFDKPNMTEYQPVTQSTSLY
jgi:hypothetical protein